MENNNDVQITFLGISNKNIRNNVDMIVLRPNNKTSKKCQENNLSEYESQKEMEKQISYEMEYEMVIGHFLKYLSYFKGYIAYGYFLLDKGFSNNEIENIQSGGFLDDENCMLKNKLYEILEGEYSFFKDALNRNKKITLFMIQYFRNNFYYHKFKEDDILKNERNIFIKKIAIDSTTIKDLQDWVDGVVDCFREKYPDLEMDEIKFLEENIGDSYKANTIRGTLKYLGITNGYKFTSDNCYCSEFYNYLSSINFSDEEIEMFKSSCSWDFIYDENIMNKIFNLLLNFRQECSDGFITFNDIITNIDDFYTPFMIDYFHDKYIK